VLLSIIIIYLKLLYSSVNPQKRKLKHIVVLNHYFSQDIASIKKSNKLFNITVISALAFGRMFRLFIKESDDEWHSFYHECNINPRNKYYIFFKKYMLPAFRFFNISAFITPSDIFPYLRDIIPLLRKNKILTVVIDKEGTISPYDFDIFASEIKKYYPFISDIILVWSQRQKEFWQNCGIVDESKIFVTGQPRSDFWFNDKYKPSKKVLKYINPSKKNILLLSFDKSAYIPEHLFKSGEVTWEQLYNEVHTSIKDFAQKYPGLNFIVKTHPQQYIDDSTREKLASQKNISIASGASLSNELIFNSDIIVGFQTTGLIEAMVCQKPIIYTYWGDAPKISDYLLPFHKTKALYVARSQQELQQYFEKILINPEVPTEQNEARNKFINEYLFNCDGHSSERCLKIINENIISL
jgi:surface carbohydrate biosynthesis protein